MNWSLDTYNLIVDCNHDAAIFKNQSGTYSFRADRLFEDTASDLKEKYRANWAGLSELPTLVLDSLGTKLQNVTTHLVSLKKLTRQQAKPIRRAAERGRYLGPSITGMHDYIHNSVLIPWASGSEGRLE